MCRSDSVVDSSHAAAGATATTTTTRYRYAPSTDGDDAFRTYQRVKLLESSREAKVDGALPWQGTDEELEMVIDEDRRLRRILKVPEYASGRNRSVSRRRPVSMARAAAL